MSIDQSILSDIGTNVAHARAFRMAATAFLRAGGIVSVGDLTVTGDPVALAVNVSVGATFVPMPGARQGFEPFIVDAVETRTLAAATSTRTDRLYIGVQSKEFGDTVNHKDLYVVTGAAGSTALPVIPPPLPAGLQDVSKIGVPAGATKGTDCTITPLLSTSAPVRSGGYVSTDINVDDRCYAFVTRKTTQSVGSASIGAGNYDTGAWTQINWDNVIKSVAPPGLDMPDVANNRMLVPTDGYITGQCIVSYPAQVPPAGLRGLRVRTIFGSLVAQVLVAADNFGYMPARLSCPYEVAAAAGHHLIAEVVHTAGTTLVMPAHGGYNAAAWAQNRAVNGS